ncbi:NADH-quinone oxidoreductase subunit A [Amylibacter sp.]|nr:NADH-quinone oxidoreductase subunit A [Amylibacter sp.]MDB9857535.1 NADH-quinone oxidoreductase subunit A [Amylibacter sp.]
MEDLLREYLPILVFIGIAVALGLVLILAAIIVAVRNPDAEKTSAYECGFNAFDDARMKFDVRFYLVSILFIIFDLEVAFLFPWAASFKDVGVLGFWSMMVFLGVLTIGFAYEWKKGALEWE